MNRNINKFWYSILLLVLFSFQSCNENHFLSDYNYRKEVHEQFTKRTDLAKHRAEALFTVFNRQDITLEEKEALEFLYAYMPLTDLADYDGDFFLNQVKGAFRARDYFNWGMKVPEDVFRHFVLVHRSSNEYLDSSRDVFFEELKDRVKGMSMYEAALEVNHWCHEKVTYRATDGRTSSPLALVKTSWGRCGEETVFTVAALRAVGIPARSAYTPRWVHTDDNHAWVEAWVDGRWYYMGACEPEPELNMAWFTAPAQRSMMMLTSVYGLYNGIEEYNKKSNLNSVINLMHIYAPTRKVLVKVVDKEGKGIEGASINFNVYNYAEFYPIAHAVSNQAGEASIISGYGDILVWASKGEEYGYIKSSATDELVTIELCKKPNIAYAELIEMNPPKEGPAPEVSEDKIRANMSRLVYEDSIRMAYMETFATVQDAARLAEETQLDSLDLFKYLFKAQGNWTEIYKFIQHEKGNSYLYPFLNSLLDKDLRDTPCDFLVDHLSNGLEFGVKEGTPAGLVAPYILSPRVERELISPWRSKAHRVISSENAVSIQKDVALLIEYIKNNIELNTVDNYYNCRITPWGVYELKVTDKISRDIFFVAVCRSVGVAARIEKATAKVQFYENNEWIDVYFEKPEAKVVMPSAKISFSNSKDNIIKPSYGSHFSLARFENGNFKSLNYYGDDRLSNYPASLTLDVGYYRYMVASRANDGSVTTSVDYFELKEGDVKNITITLPMPKGKMQVMGIVDMNSIIEFTKGGKSTLKNLSNGKGVILCFSDPGKEPTKHVLQDLPKQVTELNDWGGGVIFVIPEDKLSSTFDSSVFENLPDQTTWATDVNRDLLSSVTNTLQININDNFPLLLYVNSNGGILYSSLGYRIGLGESLIQTINTERATMKMD